MKIVDATTYTADRAWEALDLLRLEDATVRLHWTDEPYRWHTNSGSEAFVVLDGVVTMRYRVDGRERSAELRPGIIFVAEDGDEHVAHPHGAARILVVEEVGSE